jgi:hypothetical protein
MVEEGKQRPPSASGRKVTLFAPQPQDFVLKTTYQVDKSQYAVF